ncbi:bacterioferritin [Paramagnetospirillum marisnigri]|uniref:Bacterioferritin n=1 Tax=Paramagnetospirillum marisnigri TaxID=1285242 RepID=A0A178MVW9_9PROT|nr:bacterioferritin [Paramagnetospirillum marisnigri]OAN53187.1 bacterioferritin [Paramagnetospirillum marisnigri]
MQGSAKVIASLNALLTGELTAADQYFIHSRMLQNWGFQVLYQRIEHEHHDELDHADALIKRILFLEGVPDVASRAALNVGADVPAMLKNDLALEISVVAELKAAIALCEIERDYDTRRILVKMLEDTEEDHAHWLEIQIGLIERLGLKNYLQSAAGGLSSAS